MFQNVRLFLGVGLFVGLLMTAQSGCTKAKHDHGKDHKTDHAHPKVGPHGGPFADWDDKFHAEFTVNHAEKKVVVYLLDDKVKFAPNVDVSKITEMKLTVKDAKPELVIELKHDEKLSGKQGIAFVATHDYFAKPGDFEGNISGKVDGKPYGDDFTYKAPKNARLFLEPSKLYTLADIKANGGTTPAAKFKDKAFMRDDAPALKPGDRICPITNKRADAECAWVINDQRYEFCCPPCIGRFLQKARDEPGAIKKPGEYVHKAS